jgi:hypothetical protein
MVAVAMLLTTAAGAAMPSNRAQHETQNLSPGADGSSRFGSTLLVLPHSPHVKLFSADAFITVSDEGRAAGAATPSNSAQHDIQNLSPGADGSSRFGSTLSVFPH